MARKPPPRSSSLPQEQIIARCAIRVSSVGGRDTDTNRDFQSPEQQMHAAVGVCMAQEWFLDTEKSTLHADIDQSGFRKSWRKRPGITQHLEAAKRGEFQRLIVYKLSRLARNAREGLEIFDEFEKAGVSIVCVKDNIDTATAAGRLIRTILLAVAEMQAEEMREYSAEAVRTRARHGKPPTFLPTWIVKDSESGLPVIHEERAAALRRLIELRLAGGGYASIAKVLNIEGFKTSTGGQWYSSRVESYLSEHRNIERFQGVATWDLMDGTTVKIPGAYPEIASPDEIQALLTVAQTLRAPHAHNVGRRRTRGLAAAGDTQWLVSGLLHCGKCGRTLRTASKPHHKGQPLVRHYLCVECRASAEGGSTITAAMVEEAVIRVIWTIYKTGIGVGVAPSRSKQKPKAPTRTAAHIEQEMSHLVGLLLASKINQPVYDEHYQRLTDELKAVNEQSAEGQAPAMYAATVKAISEGNERAAILAAVARVDAPVSRDGGISTAKHKETRYARVTLRFFTSAGSVFYTAMHASNYRGLTEILDATGNAL